MNKTYNLLKICKYQFRFKFKFFVNIFGQIIINYGTIKYAFLLYKDVPYGCMHSLSELLARATFLNLSRFS